jgi:LSD1 subclass zinc finger protein
LNLFWLKYVSWALVGGAIFFYTSIRLNKLSLSRGAKAILCSLCVVLACVAWHVQERNADLNSPRSLIIGTVTEVTSHTYGKTGSITDSFRLQLESGSISQKFTTTDSVAGKLAQQPIHRGDLLGVLYRTWDDIPLTIDEIQGQQPGWHYHRYKGDLSVFIFTVAFVSILFLPAALVASRRKEKRATCTESTLDPND